MKGLHIFSVDICWQFVLNMTQTLRLIVITRLQQFMIISPDNQLKENDWNGVCVPTQRQLNGVYTGNQPVHNVSVDKGCGKSHK
jgi:hypothetical protein